MKEYKVAMKQSSWSRKYYKGLEDWKHNANDAWFKKALVLLSGKGVLFVPNLQNGFNKKGEEV